MRVLFAFAALCWAVAASASPITGQWAGFASKGGEARNIRIHLETSQSGLRGWYDIPSIGLEGIRLQKISFDPASRTYSADHQISFRIDGESLTGTIAPALLHGESAQFELARATSVSPVARERTVEFKSRGHVIRGTVVAPLRAGRYPAMVALHGSGPSTRWLALGRARKFAHAGYVSLIFDKPGSGESEGDWTRMSLDDSALDALAAMKFLREQPEVLSSQVGLWGHSQAGWTISRAAAMTDEIAFAIVLAGGGSKPQDVEQMGYLNSLRHSGADASQVAKAMALVQLYFDYLRDGDGYDRLKAELEALADQPWARSLGISRVLPVPEFQPKWSWVARYDPAVDIGKMRMPVLVLFAEEDVNTPLEGLAIWKSSLEAAQNENFEAQVIPDADHHFLVPNGSGGWPELASGYYEIQIDWLRRNARQ